jgi:hypothetical protein
MDYWRKGNNNKSKNILKKGLKKLKGKIQVSFGEGLLVGRVKLSPGDGLNKLISGRGREGLKGGLQWISAALKFPWRFPFCVWGQQAVSENLELYLLVVSDC